MEDEIDRAIKILACKVTVGIQPDQAMKYTQAALNLAHVKDLLTGRAKEQKPKGGGA